MLEIYEKFLYLQNNFDLEMSIKIFGDIGEHLFEKWLYCDRNIIDFITCLDSENKQKIFDFLLKLQ